MWLPEPRYYISRKITIPYFTPTLWILGIFWAVIITLLNIAAVGYDTESLYSQSFLNPHKLWYERFYLTKSLFPRSWNCTPSLIDYVERTTYAL
jgi:uncharacterized membrane protein